MSGTELPQHPAGEFESFFAASPIPAWVADMSSLRALEVNEAALRLFDYTREEFLGMDLRLLCLSDPRAELDTGFREVEGRPAVRLSRHRTSQGREILAEVHSQTGTFRDRPVRFVQIVERTEQVDIGPEQVAAQSLAAVQMWLRAFANEVPAVLWAVDMDGIFRLLEGADLKKYGLSPGELVGTSSYEFNAEAPDRIAVIRRTLAGEQFIESGAYEDLRYEGHYIPLRNSAGEMSGAMAIIFDVTEREAASVALRQAEKLEGLTILAGGIAHDFNNLLLGIMGNTSLALMDMDQAAPAREALEDVLGAGQRAAELARQMLAYSGRSQMSRQECDLSALVADVLVRLGARAARVTSNLARDIPAVLGDPGQLRILVNALVFNALEAAEENGGTVDISTSIEECTTERFVAAHFSPVLEAGTYAVIEVHDTGPGISSDNLARIFDPFFTTRFTGRGLGLAASLGIVRAHDGAIFVDSEPGSGARMAVYLPLAKTT